MKKENPLWCLWCGEDMEKSRRGNWCCTDCRRYYFADLEQSMPKKCIDCNKTMRSGIETMRCAACIAKRRERRPYNRRPEVRICKADGCNKPVSERRRYYCSAECRMVTHKPRYSVGQIKDIMERVASARSFSPVAKELGIGRVILIGILFRYGFTIRKATSETYRQATRAENGRFASY